tara:strand:+ start:13735 stop:14802 length:1068 start_codon:yes stop_codon:yes gene_type:complete
MKKNLRNILAVGLGLITTVAFAQDWNVDSRTRIDMGGDYDRMETSQRATLGATWGGTNWGIHGSTVVNYDLASPQNAASLAVYEAYASTDIMGYANLTIGRQALNYGSGMIIGSNEWGANRNTRDGMTFGLNLDVADVTVIYASRMDGDSLTNGSAMMGLNASKSEGDWTANLLYTSATATMADVDGDAMTAMGLDLGYDLMGGDLNLAVGYNTASDGTTDMDMTSIGATYNVNESMSISATQTTYGENGFSSIYGSNMAVGAGSWMTHGNMGYLNSSDEMLSIGGSYAMGGINLGVHMHTVSNDLDESYERNAMEFSLGYDLHDNAGLGLKYATDNNGTDTDVTYTWLTLTVTP